MTEPTENSNEVLAKIVAAFFNVSEQPFYGIAGALVNIPALCQETLALRNRVSRLQALNEQNTTRIRRLEQQHNAIITDEELEKVYRTFPAKSYPLTPTGLTLHDICRDFMTIRARAENLTGHITSALRQIRFLEQSEIEGVKCAAIPIAALEEMRQALVGFEHKHVWGKNGMGHMICMICGDVEMG